MENSKSKIIWDIDDSAVDKIFYNKQKKRGIIHGDVDPFWLMTLDLKMAREGITKEQLRRKVKEYYDVMQT